MPVGNAYQSKATGACGKRTGGRRLAYLVEALDRGQRVETGASVSLPSSCPGSLDAVSASASAPSCGSSVVLRVWTILGEMGSGCGGAWRMTGSCRGGGGGGAVDGDGQPCLHWLPSQSLDSDALSRRRGCADACDASPSFCRESGLACAFPTSGCRFRGRDDWTNLCPLVALATKSWGRSSGLADGLWVVPYLDQTNPLVSTGLNPQPGAGQP